MRIGSLVTITRMNKDGEWIVPDDAIGGTIIGIEDGSDRDGYETIDKVTIRWKDGRIEKTKLEGDDMLSDWEITDITPMLYVNLYLYDREYGGPEEGGWWYDTYSPVTSDNGDWDTAPPRYGLLPTVEEAEKAMRELMEWCSTENSTRRSPSSVISEGHYCAKLEAWPAEPMPARRPHYC